MRLIERRSRRRFRFSCAMIPSVGNPFEELDPTDFGRTAARSYQKPAQPGWSGRWRAATYLKSGRVPRPPTAAAPALIGDAIAEGR